MGECCLLGQCCTGSACPNDYPQKLFSGANILYLCFRKQEIFNVFYGFCVFKIILNKKGGKGQKKYFFIGINTFCIYLQIIINYNKSEMINIKNIPSECLNTEHRTQNTDNKSTKFVHFCICFKAIFPQKNVIIKGDQPHERKMMDDDFADQVKKFFSTF